MADDMARTQAQRKRDSRGAPEFVFNPRLGETYREALELKGNPSSDKVSKEHLFTYAEQLLKERMPAASAPAGSTASVS